MNRYLIRKRGKDIPKVCISQYYNNYKAYENLNKDELLVLIALKRKQFKNITDEESFKKTKTEIKLLEDLYYLLDNNIIIFNKYRDETKDRMFTTEIGVKANCIITRLGFKSPLYTEECINISERIKPEYIDEDIKDIISLSIVKEIMDFYNVNIDENKIILDYQIDEKKYYDYRIYINRWCKENYWIK